MPHLIFSPHRSAHLSRLLPPALLLCTLVLSACGGGGSSGGGTTPTIYTATCADGSKKTSSYSLADAQSFCAASDSTGIYKSILSTPPPDPGYVDAQKAVYDKFNKARGDCGFGYATRNEKIDQAATAHANYSVVNNYLGHYQIVGKPGFTGVNSQARMAAAGYLNNPYGSSEVANSVGVYKAGGMLAAVTRSATQLLSAPYHQAGVLGSVGHSEIGIGIPIDVDVGQGYLSGLLVVDLGTPVGGRQQSLASGDVRTYPCEGTTGTSYKMSGEVPNPVPERNLTDYPIGQPIFVMAARGHTLTILDVTISGPDGKPLVLLPTLNRLTDKSGLFNEAHYAAIMPDKPMLPLTRYTVLINGKDNNTPFTRQFTFTTGNTYDGDG